MVAYSFQKRFAEPIELGTKCQTIRAPRKRHARPGEELQLYVGMRTKHCRLIKRVRCVEAYPILLDFDEQFIGAKDGWIRTLVDLNRFAVSDGFRDFAGMEQFWRDQHGITRFEGIAIRWEVPNG